ncbi:MAG: BMP family ABC transporter substrate-binding protein [Spirochaetaceae bacterium]|jgi:simple sugar transport system substrate-binding protein|nr:BMP family ABC transporter substrate-binding protein [Spirochaetaceae bacterium]
MNIYSKMAILVIAAPLIAAGCKPKQADAVSTETGRSVSQKPPVIAVFIPGTASGSPIYEMLAAGVKRAASEYGAPVQVIEGGYNQAEWESKLTALAASGSYDLIVSSNPSLPALAQAVKAKFPSQRFLLLDGEISGDSGIYTLRYNQREQSYMAGYLAALLASEAGKDARIGLIAGQEYPAMLQTILPGYREGAVAVNPSIEVDFRVVGNWYDAAKGAELATGMIRAGVRVLLCVAGGANEGAVQAAAEAPSGDVRIIWFDTNGYAVRPPYIAGSSVLYQEKAAYNKVKLFLEGKLPFGTAELAGVRDGYVDFIEDDPLYTAAVSENVRKKQHEMLERLRSGALILEN